MSKFLMNRWLTKLGRLIQSRFFLEMDAGGQSGRKAAISASAKSVSAFPDAVTHCPVCGFDLTGATTIHPLDRISEQQTPSKEEARFQSQLPPDGANQVPTWL